MTSQLRAQSEALVSSQRETAAAVTSGGSIESAPSDAALHGSAYLTADPLEADVGVALANNAALADLVAGTRTEVLALGTWGAFGEEGEPLVLATELEVGFAENLDDRAQLFLAAIGTEVLGDGFESLAFSLERNGAVEEAFLFDTTAAVLAFFDEALFDFGDDWNARDSALARFELTVSDATEVGMRFAFVTAVPEPGTGMLLALGLVGLARTRRR